MFSVKSAKELVTNLEHLIFKNKNTEILTNDDPQQVSALHKNRLQISSYNQIRNNNQPSASGQTEQQANRQQKALIIENKIKQSQQLQPITLQQNIKNKKNQMYAVLQSLLPDSTTLNMSMIRVNPMMQKIKTIFNQYIIDNVNISAGKIKEILKDKYNRISQNQTHECKYNQCQYLQQSLDWSKNERQNVILLHQQSDKNQQQQDVFCIGEDQQKQQKQNNLCCQKQNKQ